MATSEGLQGSGVVDCRVGTIVWVRRRNGSWWPGRIVGPNDISSYNLTSPRSGTPVKLLGREDATVDWYNLEKSKRIKAFRCGEFDDCIERAECSLGTSSKKREKYARREDAILHALELEKQQIEKKHKKLGIASNCTRSKIPHALKKDIDKHSECMGNGNVTSGNLNSHTKRLGVSIEDKSTDVPLRAQKAKPGKLVSRKDYSEVLPRMVGFQDFGPRVAPSKRKLSSIASEGSKISSAEGSANHFSNSKTYLVNRRKSQGGLVEESLFRRRDRRRPLVHVLQSSEKLPVSYSLQSVGNDVSIARSEEERAQTICRAKRSRCVYLPAESKDCLEHTEFSPELLQVLPSPLDNCSLQSGSAEENSSSTESDSSERDYPDPESDEGMRERSDVAILTATEPRHSGIYGVEGQPGNMNSEEHDEPKYLSHLSPDDQTEANVGVSKWKLKGKWNIRNLIKRPGDVIDRKSSDRSSHGTHPERKGINFCLRMSGQDVFHGSEYLSYGYDEGSFTDKEFEASVVGFGNRRYSLTLDAASKDHSRIDFGSESENKLIWETNGLSQSASGYWEGKDSQSFDPVYIGHDDGMGTMLIDVDLKVQAGYQGEHVPLISLMSRLNGKAIIGHPIQIEALPDGSSDILLPRKDDIGHDLFDNDGNAMLQPVWRTSKRTSVHYAPLPHPSSALKDNKNAHGFQNSGHLGDKARRNSFSPTEKFLRKPLKNASLSNQKRRRPSSFSTEHKFSGKGDDPKHARKSYMMDGLIKPEESPPPVVTSIPVKLAFSRLLEAFGRLPSRA